MHVDFVLKVNAPLASAFFTKSQVYQSLLPQGLNATFISSTFLSTYFSKYCHRSICARFNFQYSIRWLVAVVLFHIISPLLPIRTSCSELELILTEKSAVKLLQPDVTLRWQYHGSGRTYSCLERWPHHIILSVNPNCLTKRLTISTHSIVFHEWFEQFKCLPPKNSLTKNKVKSMEQYFKNYWPYFFPREVSAT